MYKVTVYTAYLYHCELNGCLCVLRNYLKGKKYGFGKENLEVLGQVEDADGEKRI